MICDGVGLGKSFIALALMERFCQEKKNVLLIAPKNIMSSSWDGYLDDYLAQYRQPFGTLHQIAMTELGFDYEADGEVTSTFEQKRDLIRKLFERADAILAPVLVP